MIIAVHDIDLSHVDLLLHFHRRWEQMCAGTQTCCGQTPFRLCFLFLCPRTILSLFFFFYLILLSVSNGCWAKS